jgi:hypothetical protein
MESRSAFLISFPERGLAATQPCRAALVSLPMQKN